MTRFTNPDGGSLRIFYSDGTTVDIAKEKGRYEVEQAAFTRIQIASDRQCIGWVATYAICAQSYPCAAELVIVRAGGPPRHLAPDTGIVWDWAFMADGKQVVMHSGFPHGDDKGKYALYESASGRRMAVVTPGDGTPPAWVKYLQAREH